MRHTNFAGKLSNFCIDKLFGFYLYLDFRYRDHREPHDAENKYEFTSAHYHLLAARLIFFVVFEVNCFFLKFTNFVKFNNTQFNLASDVLIFGADSLHSEHAA